jgi:preprotein translocase subunit SecY
LPYITASIIVQMMTQVIPRLETLRKQGQSGQAKITQYTRYVSVGHPGEIESIYKVKGISYAAAAVLVIIVVTTLIVFIESCRAGHGQAGPEPARAAFLPGLPALKR